MRESIEKGLEFTSKIIGCWEYLTKVEDELVNLNNV